MKKLLGILALLLIPYTASAQFQYVGFAEEDQPFSFVLCFVDNTDGDTEETALTLTQADVRLSKNGGAFAQSNNTTPVGTHDENGCYPITLNATDMNTPGLLQVFMHEDGSALEEGAAITILPAVAYRSLYASYSTGSYYHVQVIGPTGNTTTALHLNELTALPDGAIANIGCRILDVSGGYIEPCNPTNWTSTGDILTVDTLSFTPQASTDVVWLFDRPLSSDSTVAGAVWTNATRVLTANTNLGIGTPTDLGGGATLAANNTDMAGATFSSATDSQEAIRDRGDAAWITGGGSGLTPLASGTAQGGTSTTIQLAASETIGTTFAVRNVIKIISGTGAGQSRMITSYNGSTDTATVSPSWSGGGIPDATSVYEMVDGPAYVAVFETNSINANAVAADVATELSAARLATAEIEDGQTFTVDFPMFSNTTRVATAGLTVGCDIWKDGVYDAMGCDNAVNDNTNGAYAHTIAAAETTGISKLLVRYFVSGYQEIWREFVVN